MITPVAVAAGESVTAAAIRRLLEEYVAAPLLHLREINAQVHLGNLILQELRHRREEFQTTVTVSKDGRGGSSVVDSDTPTLRVQHEMKLQVGETPTPDRSDIVLLKAAPARIHLKRAPNGTLDVVAPVSIESVKAVIEIKAACSFDPEQRHLFRMDVAKLRALVPVAFGDSPELHFVLIDKSLPVGPHPAAFGPPPVTAWESGAPGGLQVAQKKEVVIKKSPQLTLETASGDERLVHVWDLAANLEVRHRVCTAVRWPDLEEAARLGLVKKVKNAA